MIEEWLETREYDPESAVAVSIATTGFKIDTGDVVAVALIKGDEERIIYHKLPLGLSEDTARITKIRYEDVDNGLSEADFQKALIDLAGEADFLLTHTWDRFMSKWFLEKFPVQMLDLEVLDVPVLTAYLDAYKFFPSEAEDLTELHQRLIQQMPNQMVPKIDTLAYERAGYRYDADIPIVVNRVRQVNALYKRNCQLL